RRRVRLSAAGAAQSHLSLPRHAIGDRARLPARCAVRNFAGASDRAQPRAGAQSFAVDYLFADGAGAGAGADLHRGAGRDRPARPFAEIDHLGLSLLFPDRDRDGEGLHLARPVADRIDADLVGDPAPGALETAMAVRGAVPV